MVLAWLRSTCYIDLFNLMPEKVIDLFDFVHRLSRQDGPSDFQGQRNLEMTNIGMTAYLCKVKRILRFVSLLFSASHNLLQRIWRILSLCQFKPWWRPYALPVATDCDYQYVIVSSWPVVANLWFFKQANVHFMFALGYPQWEARSEQIMMVGG